MNNADLYRKSNSLQKRDALRCLEEHANKIKWKKIGDRVIDLGCADGSVTDILKVYMPKNYGRLVGCDISEEMVKYANKHHGFGRTSFRVLDIEGDLTADLKQGFDHVFSFYTLHWIRDQERAFRNIFNLLGDEGDCLLLFLGHTPIFDVYRTLSHTEKWHSWLEHVDRFISPYHDNEDPEKEVKKIMERVGFSNIEVQCKTLFYVYDDLDVLKKSVAAINPFNIPKDILEDFLEDYIDVVREMRLLDRCNNNVGESVSIKFNYKVISVYARKLCLSLM
ncbi:juvenile hormone acid O-methyltransferase [Bombyx mandarina]|uniref:Juvenile hormone acid O-methyltransferase n=2 Tax=Bombyx TaxID=7090 RepID=JHAMT_BOMMO|nr:juvenile hormone acid O-methyltransferase [Bombyx mori]XP_028034452.1 juvenile hormone acid O-methyltransferase [Bombyx mandarina]XP_037870195.1 juvenile hormone acid O-methyltransferase isoform X1 [Bombyx mori]Q767F1.1 RecName: Full=Juvenile hormone acid O-methyltransferase; AltName: Full=Juvenile hormone acid methyltransferase; Short=BmJHAMT [Bombyx mori]BAC98835.1 juvenile hormone acid methyltransferase [Bombyx mori]